MGCAAGVMVVEARRAGQREGRSQQQQGPDGQAATGMAQHLVSQPGIMVVDSSPPSKWQWQSQVDSTVEVAPARRDGRFARSHLVDDTERLGGVRQKS
jgi:hypothetical protein